MFARSSTPDRRGHAPLAAAILSAAVFALIAVGCTRESPEAREVRKSTQGYLKALARADENEIRARSTCIASTNTYSGGRVLHIEDPTFIPFGTLDSLTRATMLLQRSADSIWVRADEQHADSLRERARNISQLASVYRNAQRAAAVSSPGAPLGRGLNLELRLVRVRSRYAGPVIGPKPVDVEEFVRVLRRPGGRWIVFSKYAADRDPWPEVI